MSVVLLKELPLLAPRFEEIRVNPRLQITQHSINYLDVLQVPDDLFSREVATRAARDRNRLESAERRRTFLSGGKVAIDTETTGLDVWLGCRPFAVSMCNEEGETWYCEWPVDPFSRRVYADKDDVEYIRSIVENPDITKVFHNGKFDVRMLDVAHGIKFKGRLEETLFAARACNSLEENYTLKGLADRYLGIGREDNDRLLDETKHLRGIAKDRGYAIGGSVYEDYWLPKHFYPESTLCQEYAELDAIRTMLLWNMYDKAMDEEEVRINYDFEMALWDCTYAMETRGVLVRVKQCKEEYAKNLRIQNESKAKAFALAGRELNLNSGPQIVKVCEERNLVLDEFTNSGKPSVSFNSIRRIADDPFIHQLQRHRAAQKVNNTFIDKYLAFAVPDPYNRSAEGGECLHPMFNQAAAQTGRYGCSRPNLQQVVNANGARNATETMSARMAFGPRPGYKWYHFDYSQLELYLFAGAANEQFMLNHMLQGNDLHAECANKAWGGRGNPNALIKGAVALEAEADHPSTPNVKRIWDEYGWDIKWAIDREAKNKFTAWWLDTYGGDNWDIVKAEKALGKKVARTRAKFVMYAKIYGGGPKAIKGFLYCSDEEAKAFQLDYDTAFPQIKRFIKQMAGIAERNGYVLNPFGRKVQIPEGYYYKATNYLIQSTAADLLKSAMKKTYDYIHSDFGRQFDAHLLMTIHDELLFEIADQSPELEPSLKVTLNADGTEHKTYYFPESPNPTTHTGPTGDKFQQFLTQIKLYMEDHEGKFAVPVPVECARCDERWDVKINLPL